ncbi:MAG TPA: caspase family protein, partial [Ktedonobacteraceae bacterium]
MQRYALLLGSNGGPRADSHLKCAESDVDKVHNWLLSNPFWVEENIWLPREEPHRQHKSAYGTGASLPQARTEIAKATKRLTRKDFLFVYFAGHAISDKGDLYLMLANSLDDDPRSCLPAHELIDPFLVHGRARCILVVLDCCFAGMATRYAFARWVKSIESRLAQFTAAQAPEQSDPGRALLAACAADQFAFEPLDEIESSSYFTEAFLAGCDGGSGPLASPSPINENGVVTAGSLHDYLVEALKKRQAPQRAITGESIAIRSSHDWRLQRGQPGYRPPESTMLPEGEGIKMPITNVTPTRVWAHPQGTNKQSTR